MEFVNALLLAIASLGGVVSFLFFKLWSFAENRIKELKAELAEERAENAKMRQNMEDDLERIVVSVTEVVKSNTSLLKRTLDEK